MASAARTERKTIRIAEFKKGVNLMLGADPAFRSEEFRLGAASALEHALHLANAYRGFRYIGTENAERTPDGGLVDGTYDDSRRFYY